MRSKALNLVQLPRYAVLWTDGGRVHTGRLDTYPDRLELHGRDGDLRLPLEHIADVTIARGLPDRLRGLPVLIVDCDDGSVIRIASLDGPGVLQELVSRTGGRARAASSPRPASTRR